MHMGGWCCKGSTGGTHHHHHLRIMFPDAFYLTNLIFSSLSIFSMRLLFRWGHNTLPYLTLHNIQRIQQEETKLWRVSVCGSYLFFLSFIVLLSIISINIVQLAALFHILNTKPLIA